QYGLVLSEKDADRRLPMASTTKIMTALTALANAAPETVIRTAPEAVGVEGSSVYLSAGEELTLEQLLYALLLQSANDAAAAIAVGVGGSIAEFADLMNAQAQRLGLTDTHFANPHGLDADGHYTTARELAVITREALSHPLIRKIVGTRRATIPQGENPDARLLVNHNRLLRTYPDAIGVKTGFTKKSGRCLVSAAERNGVTLIAVTLNAPDDWRDHTAMLDYGFTRFDTVDICRAGDAVCSVPVTGGTAEAVPMHAAESLTAALPIGHAPIRVTVEAPHFLYAPVPLDRQTGEAVYSCDLDGDGAAEEIGRVALVTAATVERRQTEQHGFFAWLKKLFR
ncbi:MAG: serine hydrolase, partial [Eubacteriales bacterium]|nr:serine hydrolase [Eubacteriales bacterium]